MRAGASAGKAGRTSRGGSRAGDLVAYAVLLIFCAIAVYPVLQVFGIALRPADRLYSTSLAIIPPDATLHSFRVILFEKPFLLWLRNSVLLAAAVTLVSIALAATAGYAFSRYRFRGRETGLQAFLMTQMFPATMLLLPLYVLFKRVHLLDSMLGLGVAYVATAMPFCVWTMKGYYETLPRDLEEAALIDGMGPWGAFVRVVLPLAAPALAITALFSFMASWSEFMVARVILTRPQLFTLPLGLESLSGTFQTEWANYAAGSLLVCLPVVVLFISLNRFLISGLTLGGVKG